MDRETGLMYQTMSPFCHSVPMLSGATFSNVSLGSTKNILNPSSIARWSEGGWGGQNERTPEWLWSVSLVFVCITRQWKGSGGFMKKMIHPTTVWQEIQKYSLLHHQSSCRKNVIFSSWFCFVFVLMSGIRVSNKILLYNWCVFLLNSSHTKIIRIARSGVKHSYTAQKNDGNT